MAKTALENAKAPSSPTRVLILTGAGISAESGVRTFRESDGLWEEVGLSLAGKEIVSSLLMPPTSYDVHQRLVVLDLSIVFEMKSMIFAVGIDLLDDLIDIGIT